MKAECGCVRTTFSTFEYATSQSAAICATQESYAFLGLFNAASSFGSLITSVTIIAPPNCLVSSNNSQALKKCTSPILLSKSPARLGLSGVLNFSIFSKIELAWRIIT